MNRIWLCIAVVTLLFLAAGCESGVHQRLNCICLIDYSGSLSEETLHRYVDIISAEVFPQLGEKDRLVVLPIDEGAKMEAVKLVFEDLAKKEFTFHTDGYAHARDSLLMRLHNYSKQTGPEIAAKLRREKVVREKYTYYTDIFAALDQAATLVERNKEADSFWKDVERFIRGKKRTVSTNLILLFSDMVQESKGLSFAGPEGCTPDEAHGILDSLRASNHIPDLHGCTVFVNGRTGKTNQQVDNIQGFWSQYFKVTGADLASYEYDAGPMINTYLVQRGALIK
jgi:hypothetical protein